jgi:hypothetical protein
MKLRPFVSSAAFLFSSIVVVTGVARAVWPVGGLIVGPGLLVPDNSGGVLAMTAYPAVSRRVDSGGNVVWSQASGLPAGQTQPHAASSDGAGGAIVGVVIGTSPSDASGPLYVNRINVSGAILWGGSGVQVTNTHTLSPTVCSDGAGGAVVTWQDQRSGVGLNDIYAQRINAAGVPQWTAGGVPVCTATGSQIAPLLVADGSGGAIILWVDQSGGAGNEDIYAQRVDGSGSAQWAANGIPVCGAAGPQYGHCIVSDGVGGAVVGWTDGRAGAFNIYAQRVNPSGIAQWAANGIPVASEPTNQARLAMTGDGAQGAVLTWEDSRAGSQLDIYAQRVDGSGTSQWGAGGAAACTQTSSQHDPVIASDGSGGAVIGWSDERDGTSTWGYRVQRLNGSGVAQWPSNGVLVQYISSALSPYKGIVTDGTGGAYTGVPSNQQGTATALDRITPDGVVAWTLNYMPTWLGVLDEPRDQGGWVRLEVARPLADGAISPNVLTQIASYTLWRRIPDFAVVSKPVSAERARAIVKEARPGTRIDAIVAAGAEFPPGSWESVSSRPAMAIPTYTFGVPTHDDSTVNGPADDVFVITSHSVPLTTPSPPGFFYVVSRPDSGHSVDNLPPGMPLNLTGGRDGATSVHLQWTANRERDLIYYAVYRGTSEDFTPSPGNRVGTPTQPEFEDPAFAPGVSYYKVVALDRHGNSSGSALLRPGDVSEVEKGPQVASFLSRPFPNPALASTKLDYGLARGGHVILAVVDVRGRAVTELVNRDLPAGLHHAIWDGRDGAGRRVAPGIYWASLTGPDGNLRQRLVRID